MPDVTVTKSAGRTVGCATVGYSSLEHFRPQPRRVRRRHLIFQLLGAHVEPLAPRVTVTGQHGEDLCHRFGWWRPNFRGLVLPVIYEATKTISSPSGQTPRTL